MNVGEPVTIELMTRGIRKGDEHCFDLFWSRYAQRMVRYLLIAVRGDENLAIELRHEAMVRAARYMKPFDDQEQLWRWLVRLMRTALIDRVRKEKKHKDVVPLPHPDCLQVVDDGPVQDRLFELLDDALDGLSDDDKQLVESFYYDGKSQNDLARLDGTTSRAIGMKLLRLRSKLKALILRGLKE